MERIDRNNIFVSAPGRPDVILINRPHRRHGVIWLSCSFSLGNRMGMVDSIDTLGYVRVNRVSKCEYGGAWIEVSCLLGPMECMERLMVDLPELMEEWL
ncbi:MAG TPA: hypothetical protein H9824_12200 [Candidatus Bacteroides pullicola]|uniref:Uncharacterized protein n=1 Tax=Candidatus Bacteroides pullicola TaxID=2838475 RepID=A0A9D1ZJD2_9BACE|nr:hypothetical protein [Candidatus Bacteroides pullicola]